MLNIHKTQKTSPVDQLPEIVYLTDFYIEKPTFHIKFWSSIYSEEFSITKNIPELADINDISTKLQIKLFRKAFRTFEDKFHDIRVLVILPRYIREDNINVDIIYAITEALLRMSLKEREELGPAAEFISRRLLYPRYLVKKADNRQKVLAIV